MLTERRTSRTVINKTSLCMAPTLNVGSHVNFLHMYTLLYNEAAPYMSAEEAPFSALRAQKRSGPLCVVLLTRHRA